MPQDRNKEGIPLTKVFAKAGLDNVTSAMCYYQQRFGLDVQCSTLVHIFNFSFSIGHLYRAGRTMNSLPSQILERYTLWLEPLFYFSSNLKNLSSLFGRIGLLLKRNKIIFSSSS